MEEKIRAIRCAWSEKAAGALSISLDDDVDVLAEQVRNGVAELWHFEKRENIDIWIIVRREFDELVVCCLEGIGVRFVVPLIERSAKKAGCTSIRAHTLRQGLAKMFPEWELREYIYKKVLV